MAASEGSSSLSCPNCGSPVPRNEVGRPRRFCSRSCTVAFYNARTPRTQRVLHSLSHINEPTRTAVCSVCGPDTRIWKGGNARERWRCSNRVRAQVSRAWQRDPDLERERKWASRGILAMTVERFQTMLEEQAGCCALCGVAMVRPVVDHNHETGEVRRLLCVTCNTGLGKFGDDPARLRAGAAYLERSS